MGVAIIETGGRYIDRASLHRNLTLLTTELLDTQIIYIDLINDFNIKNIRILLNGRAPFPEWKLILIILCSIIGGVVLIGVAVVVVKKVKQYRMLDEEEEPRETLITEDLQQ